MDAVTSTSPNRQPAEPQQSTMPGTAYPSGSMICGPHSSCGSPGARSAPGRASAPGPRWWIMWSPTGETGPGSSTGPISRACASVAMTEKQHRNRRKNGGKQLGAECEIGAMLGRTPALPSRSPAPAASPWLAGLPPGLKKFQGQVRKTVRPPSCGIFSPRRNRTT